MNGPQSPLRPTHRRDLYVSVLSGAVCLLLLLLLLFFVGLLSFGCLLFFGCLFVVF